MGEVEADAVGILRRHGIPHALEVFKATRNEPVSVGSLHVDRVELS